MSYWLWVWISIGLWAHCVGSNAHVMSEIEIAGQGISVWRIRYCGNMWWFIFKNTFRHLEKDKMAAQELYSVPSIYFSRPGGRCIVSGAQFLCIKMTTIIITFNLICHHSFYLLKIYWNRWWDEIWTWRTKGSTLMQLGSVWPPFLTSYDEMVVRLQRQNTILASDEPVHIFLGDLLMASMNKRNCRKQNVFI